MSAVLKAIDINYAYGGVSALAGVTLQLEPGRVVALLGGNGAGKSTLIRILSGMLQPASGRIVIDGADVEFRSPRHARESGIATVYQDLALIPLLSVWRNFVLGAEPVRQPFGRLDVRRARDDAQRGLDRFGLSAIDLDRPAARLSGGQRQVLAIARALHGGARVLILDEPTAALAVDQTQRVLDAIRNARGDGCAILLVTHNPRHALAVADRITLLRLGRVAGEWTPAELNELQLSELLST